MGYYDLLKAEKVGGGNYYDAILARQLAGALPSGYEIVDHVYNPASSTLLRTGFKPDADDLELEIKVRPVSGSWYMFQARTAAGQPIIGITGSELGKTMVAGLYGGETVTSAISRTSGHVYTVKYTAKSGNCTFYVKDETNGDEDTKTETYTFAPVNAAICLYGNTAGARVNANTSVYYAKMKKSGNLVMDYAPCVHGTTGGFWDYVSRTFITPTEGTLKGVRA